MIFPGGSMAATHARSQLRIDKRGMFGTKLEQFGGSPEGGFLQAVPEKVSPPGELSI